VNYLLTIDVWDTLLRRRCHPDLIKLAVARFLLLKHFDGLKRVYQDHWEIFRERCRVEKDLADKARKSGMDDEYTIKDVFSWLTLRIFRNINKSQESLVHFLIHLEFELECQYSFMDPSCRKFLKEYPAEKTIFLSDFHMPASMLSQLLQRHGLTDLVWEGISSCDIGLNKRSGNLFKHVHEKFKVSPNMHVHIGDNPLSDVFVPKQLGIQVVHYDPVIEREARRERERLFVDRRSLFEHIKASVMQAVPTDLLKVSKTHKSAFILGIYSAPWLIGFILFVAERCILDKRKKLFFFTREGEFFKRLYDELFPDGYLGKFELPQGQVLAVSRLSTFCASLRSISVSEMMRLWNLYSTQSMLSLCNSLGIDSSKMNDLCSKYGLTLTERVIYPWKDERVQRMFNDNNFKKIVLEESNQDRQNLMAYLRQCGIANQRECVSVVDIGWRGSIQDNLAALLPNVHFAGYYLGLQRFLNSQEPNCTKYAFGPNLNNSSLFSYLLDSVTPIEMLCNSPFGSVKEYRADPFGDVIATRFVDKGENAVYEEFTGNFQDGVIWACQHWRKYIDDYAIMSSELRFLACDIWETLVRRTPQQLADAYASLKHNEVFGLGQFIDKKPVPSVREIFRGFFNRKDRQEVILFLRLTPWISGLWRRSDLGLFHKVALIILVKFVKFYKYIRLRTRCIRMVWKGTG